MIKTTFPIDIRPSRSINFVAFKPISLIKYPRIKSVISTENRISRKYLNSLDSVKKNNQFIFQKTIVIDVYKTLKINSNKLINNENYVNLYLNSLNKAFCKVDKILKENINEFELYPNIIIHGIPNDYKYMPFIVNYKLCGFHHIKLDDLVSKKPTEHEINNILYNYGVDN